MSVRVLRLIEYTYPDAEIRAGRKPVRWVGSDA